MRIALANPPWNVPGFYGVRAGSRWPHLEDDQSRYLPFPFFLAYTAAVLEQNGYDPLIIDAIGEKITIEAFLHKLEKFAPEFLVLEVSTPSFQNDLSIIELIRDRLGPDLLIALCGPNQLMLNNDFLKDTPIVDFVFRGEFEFITLELVKAIEKKTSFEMIKGIIYRDLEGNVHYNPDRELLKSIDELPWPSRHQLPMLNYYDEIGDHHLPMAQMWASRGCPYMCIFCVWPQMVYGGSNYRVRDPSDVADEMAWLVRTYGVNLIYFDDDTFNIGKVRMLKLSEEIKRRQLNVRWAIMARADGMDREVLESMKNAGLFSVKYGVESGDQTILDRSDKKLSLSTVRNVVQMTRDLGIQYHLTFTFGLPGETRDTAKRTLALALELDPTSAQFSICTPMPGSKYYESALAQGFLTAAEWTQYTGFNSAVIRTTELSSNDLERIRDNAQKVWDRHVVIRKRRNLIVKSLGRLTGLFDSRL